MDEFIIETVIDGIKVKGLCKVMLAKFVEFMMMEPYANVNIPFIYEVPDWEIRAFHDLDHARRFTIDNLRIFLRQADIMMRHKAVAGIVLDSYKSLLDKLLGDFKAETSLSGRARFAAQIKLRKQAYEFYEEGLNGAIPELRQAIESGEFIISPKLFDQLLNQQ
ncbi:MAG: hypothetical protein HDR49_01380 [Bacteroides sp.]|nr:hypothetical protein [Bacteroides sp.]